MPLERKTPDAAAKYASWARNHFADAVEVIREIYSADEEFVAEAVHVLHQIELVRQRMSNDRRSGVGVRAETENP